MQHSLGLEAIFLPMDQSSLFICKTPATDPINIERREPFNAAMEIWLILCRRRINAWFQYILGYVTCLVVGYTLFVDVLVGSLLFDPHAHPASVRIHTCQLPFDLVGGICCVTSSRTISSSSTLVQAEISNRDCNRNRMLN